MKVYDRNGWVNWEYFCSLRRSFIMLVGARGVGKTYGLMKWLIENGKPFIYIRRLQAQLDMSGSESGNPFKKINSDLGIDIRPVKNKKMLEFRDRADNNKIIALGAALSTVATIRGFDFSGYDFMLFDECVPMASEKPIKAEFDAFLNFYETVNRNRELENNDPVKCIMLGNANQLLNPYFTGWHFTKTALKMISGHQMIYTTPDQTRTMVLLFDSPISRKKAKTALYKNASAGFLSMALDNAFRTDATNIRSEPLKEYNHIVSVGDIGIYKHKSERRYFISNVTSTPHYDDYGIKLRQFQNDYWLLRSLYLDNKIMYFENYENEILFREYLKLT